MLRSRLGVLVVDAAAGRPGLEFDRALIDAVKAAGLAGVVWLADSPIGGKLDSGEGAPAFWADEIGIFLLTSGAP